MEPLRGHIAVLGTGVTGRAVADYVARRAAAGDEVDVKVFDERDDRQARIAAGELSAAGIDVGLGASALDRAYDLVVASPGIPPASPLLRDAVSRADRTIGEIEFAYERSVAPWLAVTGTNGKTTVTSLCAHLLAYAGVPNECVGNIGQAAIAVAEEVGPAGVIVAEVSSFQLALTERFRPRVGVLLNITPDHIDWHGSFQRYAEDKARLFANMGPDDTAVIDIDDEGSAPYADRTDLGGARIVRVSRRGVPEGGAGVRDGALCLDTGGSVARVLATSELRIRGEHNVANALAAAAAASAFGVDPAVIGEALALFEPIAHRLQTVGVVDGVEYVNDSKATNPGATRMALTAYDDRAVVLLLGGRNKGNDFSVLSSAIHGCRAVIAFGEAGPEICAALEGRGTPVLLAEDLRTATVLGRDQSCEGDVVLLSPACASFDEFGGYAHRGTAFASLVGALATGEVLS